MPSTALARRWRWLLAAGLYLALVSWSAISLLDTSGHRSISVLCSSVEELCRDWAEGFSRRSGIDVVVVRLSTGEALARLSRPEGLGEFDVWHGGPADSYVIAAERGLLAPYQSPEAAAVPARYRDPTGLWTGTYLGLLGFCSNQTLLDRLGISAPTSWDDLLDERLERLVSAPDPLSSGTGYTSVWTQRVRLGSNDAAMEYLRRLYRNVLQLTNSGISPAGIVARGEAAVAITFSQHCLRAVDQGNEQLRITYPREGSGFEIGSVAVLAGAQDPVAAHSYVDYAISSEGQLAGDSGWPAQPPTRGELAADPRIGVGAVLLDYTPAEAAAARDELTELVVAEVRR